MNASRLKRGGQGGRTPPQFLADQLTLSRPGGAHYPHPVLHAPPDFQTLRHACLDHWWKVVVLQDFYTFPRIWWIFSLSSYVFLIEIFHIKLGRVIFLHADASRPKSRTVVEMNVFPSTYVLIHIRGFRWFLDIKVLWRLQFLIGYRTLSLKGEMHKKAY